MVLFSKTLIRKWCGHEQLGIYSLRNTQYFQLGFTQVPQYTVIGGKLIQKKINNGEDQSLRQG